MKLPSFALAVLAGVSLTGMPSFAQANGSDKPERPWMVRLRILTLNPANQSDAFTALETNFPANAVHISTKTFPEVDLSYFFTRHIAAELVLTYPQDHDVTLAGTGIGTLQHLPPTLSIQYHHDIPNTRFKPYVGIGVNYTHITRTRLAVAGTALDVDRYSLGFAYGAGVDYEIGKNLYLNLDYKHLDLSTNVKVQTSGAVLTNARVDPDLLSFGIGYRF